MKHLTSLAALLLLTAIGCHQEGMRTMGPSFDDDLAFLQQHTDVLVLGADNPWGPRVAVVPQYQGRIMTSTTGGRNGASFGWLNNELIASGEFQEHINVFGGEDRFWLGPEGGQFSIFFKGGDPFDLTHWQTPAVIDTIPYKVTSQDNNHVSFHHEAQLTNYSGTTFDVQIDRTVRMINRSRVPTVLELQSLPDVELIAFESENRLTNTGDQAWTHQSGALSVWILGMFRPADDLTVIVPYHPGMKANRGPVVNDAYFGKVPSDRLVMGDGVVYFKGDGQRRSKIGIPPMRAKNVLGSYDPILSVLTITQYNQPPGATEYVNSMWEMQTHPFAGDVVNSYNDGPPEPGARPLGPFYELETSSPAAFLKPDESITHIHRTFHFQGSEEDLNTICRDVLGVSLEEVKGAF